MNSDNSPAVKLNWSALEYEEKERSRDWFWALGVIVVTGSVASIIFENYFFAALLIISGLLLAFFAIRKPEIVDYEVNEEGLRAKNRLYPYENIMSFWVQADFAPGSSVRPLLFIHSRRAFMPVVSVPIPLEMAEDIHAVFYAQEIPEVEMKEHMAEKIMEALGF